jgi:hypothetical protein
MIDLSEANNEGVKTMATLPYGLMEVGMTYNGTLFMQDRYNDNPFYVSIADEYIAAMIIRMNTSAYMYASDKVVQCGNYCLSADSIADRVQECFTKMYAGKRGRKPNIAFYIADGNTGEILREVRP